MKVIWIKIKTWFKLNILFPIMAQWNYFRYGQYIPNNIRNRGLLQFCEKIMENPQYKPQSIYENLYEDKLIEVYNNIHDYIKKTHPEEKEIIDESTYEFERPYCAAAIYENLLQLLWIED